MLIKTTLLRAISISLILIATAHAEERVLKNDEIKALLPGATMSGLNSRGTEWMGKFSADGTFTLEVPSKDWSDHGTWDVANDRYCSERTQRGHKCSILRHVEGQNYILEDDRGEEMKIKIIK